MALYCIFISPPPHYQGKSLSSPVHVYVHSDKERAAARLSIRNISSNRKPPADRSTVQNEDPTSLSAGHPLSLSAPTDFCSVPEMPPNCPCKIHDHNGLPKGSCPSFKNEMVSLVQKVFESGLPNRDGLRILLSDHSLHAHAWETMLSGYFDSFDITESVKFGWDLGLSENPMPRDAKYNHPSA